MPVPLAIPLKRLFLAHGISPILAKSSDGDILYFIPRFISEDVG